MRETEITLQLYPEKVYGNFPLCSFIILKVYVLIAVVPFGLTKVSKYKKSF